VPIFLERAVIALCITVAAAIWLANPMKFDTTQKVTLSLSLLLLAYFAAHTVYRHNESSKKEAATAPAAQATAGAEPEVVLIAPKDPHRYRWVPLQRIAIDQGSAIPKELGVPIFRLNNLSNAAVTDVRITWKVADPTPIQVVFLTSQHFKRYNASIDPADSFAPFHLSNPKYVAPGKNEPTGGSVGMPASDEETDTVPFLQPTATSDNGVDVSMPLPIAYGYGFRLVATGIRPDITNQPAKGGGMIKSVGPPLEVSIIYRQSGKDYVRNFRITSSVVSFSDTAYESGIGGNVEQQYWSPDNFRALVKFTASWKD
jgi:hypothetical protein